MDSIISIALRSVTVYVCIIIAIRIFGKKELTQLSVIDLVFILLISNSVQNAMVGSNTSLWGGIIAAGSLFVANHVLNILSYRSPKIRNFFEGNPLLLVYQGKPILDHAKAAQISTDELEAIIREHGIEQMKDVDMMILEADGNISVLSENYHKKTTTRRHAHKIIEKTN